MQKKKRLFLCLTMSLLLLALPACSGSSGNTKSAGAPKKSNGNTTKAKSNDKVKIEFWMLPVADESIMQNMVDEFNTDSTDVNVNMTLLDWSSGREQIKQGVAAGSGPDVFYLGAGLTADYINGDLLLPLKKAGYTADDIEMYGPLIEASCVDGELYAAPIVYDTYILYYRTDILKEYGFDAPPSTWEEMKDMAKKITEDSGGKIMGYQHKGADDQLNAINYTWQTLLQQNGGNLMDLDNMKSTENTPEAVEALEYLASYYKENISKMGTSANNGFREGKVAMFTFTQGPITTEGYVDDANMKGKWAIAQLPTGKNGNSGHLDGHAVCVNAKTKHPKEAGQFVKSFTGPGNVAKWMGGYYGIQPYDLNKIDAGDKAAIEKVINSAPELWNPIIDQGNVCSPDFMIQTRYGYTARWDGQKRLIIAALNGEMTPQEALKQLDTEIDQAL